MAESYTVLWSGEIEKQARTEDHAEGRDQFDQPVPVCLS